MKYLPLIGLLALTMSCKDETVDRQFTIEEGSSQQISSDGNATLTVTTIQNSLCPAGAVCIRAGEVLVDVAATQDGNTTPVSLCKGPDCQTLQKGKPVKTTVNVGSHVWTLELVDALTTNPEKAVLKVTVQ